MFEQDSWRRAGGIVDRPAADRKHRLEAVALGHRTIVTREQQANVLKRRLVEKQFDADRLGHGVARQVVGRGSQAAGRHDQVRPGQRQAKDLDVSRQVVGHGRVG